MSPTSDRAALSDDTYKWRAFAAIGISFFTNVMTMSMVFVALSAIADDFGVTLRAVSWFVIVEALIISSMLLPMGRVADIVGRRRMHLSGLVVFGTGAVLVGLAPTFPLLIAARVVMSTGNAMGQSVGTAMVVAVFPEHERGKAVGSQTTAVSIGGASGPLVAGLALQVLPWEALFLLLVIPVGVAFVAGWILLDEERVSGTSSSPGRFDRGGALLSAAAVTLLVLTINNPLAIRWDSPVIVIGAVAAVVFFVLFVRWELAADTPMLELRLFGSSLFTMSVATRLFGFTASSATRFLLPIYLISFRGLAEGAAGAVLFLISLGMGIAAQSSGRLSDRLGSRPFVIGGLALLTATSLFLVTAGEETSFVVLSAVVFAGGLANGAWNVPNNATILSAVPASDLGVIGAFTNLTRNVGNVFGQAVASAVVVGVMVSQGFDIPLSEVRPRSGPDRPSSMAGASPICLSPQVPQWRSCWPSSPDQPRPPRGLQVHAGSATVTVRRVTAAATTAASTKMVS